ncbi:glutamic acid-rich protein isoform X1 [Diabrotica virgifera virgifera]|uniref:Glutamic acid-rich protein-like isoform X1 n=2 Tax=Diabrotica virgifera virgifera TaxID=50390 RepID=A0A6P7FQ18_DIAVI|nr:glutamic acid-rich protein isoform X1 [Diabrotica virgifera virgifera]
MELIKGTCFFCANSKVVSDFESVHNTIITLFSGKIQEDKLINLKPPKVCPLCYHSFVLMKRTHDDILHSSSAEKVHENCHLCGNSEDVINVSKWAHFKAIGKDFPGSNGENISNVCSDCLYYLETKSTVKEKLISEYPILKQESIISQFDVLGNSTPTRRTRTKAERKSPIDIVDLTVAEPVATPTDNMKFRPLKTDRHLRRSRAVNTDPKLLNQVLIIKLPNQSLKEEATKSAPKRKSLTPKRVRFRDEHEHIIDKYNSPSLYTDKENAYKETEELVEYEIKTTPRRSRYRSVDDTESSPDSLDPRKKSFFKIKLMKKKPKSIIAKPFKTVTNEPLEKYNDAIEKRKDTIGKRKTSAHKGKETMQKLVNRVCKFNLVVNVERMNYSEINGINQSGLSIDELDPLRIDSWEENFNTEVNESNKQPLKTKKRGRPKKRSVSFSDEKVKEEKNGPLPSKNGKKGPALKEKVKPNTSSIRRASKRNSIVSVSSEDEVKPVDIKKPRPLRKRRNTVSIEESSTPEVKPVKVKTKKGVKGTVEKKSEIRAKEIKKPLKKRRSNAKIKDDVNAAKEINAKEAVNGSEETELNADIVETTTENTNLTEESNIKEVINGSEEKESDIEIRAADSSGTEITEKADTEPQEEESREVETVSDSDVNPIDAEEKVVDENSEKCENKVDDASSDKEDKSESESLNKEDENVQNESLDTAEEKVDDNDVENNENESVAKENEQMDTETLDQEDITEDDNVDQCGRKNNQDSDEENTINLAISDTDQTTENEISRKDDTIELESEKEVTDQDEDKNDNEISDKDDSKILDESSAVEDDTVEENINNSEKENDNGGNLPEQELCQTENENFDEVEDQEEQTENENPVGVEDTEDRTEDEEVTTADEVNTADEDTTADEVYTVDDSSQLEDNTETEEKDSHDVSIEQNGENTEEDLSQDIEDNDTEETEEEQSRNKDVTEQQENEANGEVDNGETDNGETDNGEAHNGETDNGEADNEENPDESKNDDLEFGMTEDDNKRIAETLAAFEDMSYTNNEESEIVNLDTSCEVQDNEVAGEKRKRNDSEDSFTDESSPDAKRKKVTFNEDFDENV